MVKETTAKTLQASQRQLLSKLQRLVLDSELKQSELNRLGLQRAFETKEFEKILVLLG